MLNTHEQTARLLGRLLPVNVKELAPDLDHGLDCKRTLVGSGIDLCGVSHVRKK